MDYNDPFCINLGKIYGIMDDLRTESPSVQAKHIAAAKALIESTDIDGFRVDTPMQVDLGFFKKWAPEIKRFAKESLNKTNFGLWGEFFVLVGRYATMTGRGKDRTMYGKDEFIDDVSTLNGGIDYAYYHWQRYHLLRNEIGDFPLPEAYRGRLDGLMQLWEIEKNTTDTFNPLTGNANTMWHFCNNHDQWRMQAIDDVRGVELMKSCLGWLTFWTGVPLHYAGDEQAFKTYGTALDGWAREELSLSLAWRAIGTLPMRDAFDMAAPMYVYIQRLNRLRDAYLHPSSTARRRCEATSRPARKSSRGSAAATAAAARRYGGRSSRSTSIASVPRSTSSCRPHGPKAPRSSTRSRPSTTRWAPAASCGSPSARTPSLSSCTAASRAASHPSWSASRRPTMRS